MLHTETVERTTLELLRKLQAERATESFCLAGGTALALYLGHRKSIDLDLFSPSPFNVPELREHLESEHDFRTDFSAKNTLKGTIGGIKTDFITHAYEYLAPPYQEQGVRLYSMEDIVAMKLSAIVDNGTRLKDFIDIAFLSTRISFYSMLKCYERKFSEYNIIRPFKAITYFKDIDFDEDIVMLSGTYDWESIEKRLTDMTIHQERIFATFPIPAKE